MGSFCNNIVLYKVQVGTQACQLNASHPVYINIATFSRTRRFPTSVPSQLSSVHRGSAHGPESQPGQGVSGDINTPCPSYWRLVAVDLGPNLRAALNMAHAPRHIQSINSSYQ